MKITAKRKMRYPMALERAYAKTIVAHTNAVLAIVKGYLKQLEGILDKSVVFDSTTDELSSVVERMRQNIEALPSMKPAIEKTYTAVYKYATKELEAIFQSVFGTVPYMAGKSTARGDDEMQEMIDKEVPFEQLKRMWVQQNIDYIKSIDEETLRRIRDAMATEIIGTAERKELTKVLSATIEKISKVEKNHAVLIGRDQVGKLYGRIEEYQQRQLGIDEYKWVTAGDERVRPTHRALNGQTFSWKKPPPEGHPGYPIQCRCIADPIIDINKIAMKPKAGTYTPVDVQPPVITSVADTKNFKELTDFLQKQYNIAVDDVVAQTLDFKQCKMAIQGIERIKKEFPKVEIASLGTKNRGVMCASFFNEINFNPEYFFAGKKKVIGGYKTAKSMLADMYEGKTTGFHPKNNDIVSTGAHEAGHLLEAYLCHNGSTSSIEQIIAWNKRKYSTRIVSTAVKRLKAKGDKRLTEQFIDEVSRYAKTNRGECLAECVADVVANGKDASPLSLEVWDILKEEIQ